MGQSRLAPTADTPAGSSGTNGTQISPPVRICTYKRMFYSQILKIVRGISLSFSLAYFTGKFRAAGSRRATPMRCWDANTADTGEPDL
jgi:hypothetical protein